MNKIEYIPLSEQDKAKPGIKRPRKRHRKVRVNKKQRQLIQYVNQDTFSINMIVSFFILLLAVLLALVIIFK